MRQFCETNPLHLSVVSGQWSVVSCSVLTIAAPGARDLAVAGPQNSTNEPKVHVKQLRRHSSRDRNRRERTQSPSVSNARAPLSQQRTAKDQDTPSRHTEHGGRIGNLSYDRCEGPKTRDFVITEYAASRPTSNQLTIFEKIRVGSLTDCVTWRTL
jgi:hypothetical protein